MKFVLLVEGHTEKEAAAGFLKRWLDPRLDTRVGVQTVRFDGYAQLQRKLVRKTQMYLDDPSGDKIIAVIGLLDLYGPTFYPDHLRSAGERYDWGVEHLQEQVDRPKFRMFFAVHEFEAWILSQPDHLPPEVQSALPGCSAHPETVDFEEPPSKLLNRIYRDRMGRGYKKTTYGKDLFSRLDPKVAAAKCPRLRGLLEEMLRLAKAAGL